MIKKDQNGIAVLVSGVQGLNPGMKLEDTRGWFSFIIFHHMRTLADPQLCLVGFPPDIYNHPEECPTSAQAIQTLQHPTAYSVNTQLYTSTFQQVSDRSRLL